MNFSMYECIKRNLPNSLEYFENTILLLLVTMKKINFATDVKAQNSLIHQTKYTKIDLSHKL